jgi:perosamine synthetase
MTRKDNPRMEESKIIPVNEPVIGRREIEYVNECLETGWISSAGRFIPEFEEKWAGYCRRRHGVAVANGTVALELSMACLDLQPGDEVILPAFTIISCAVAVLRAGGTPVLVDSDPGTWCLNTDRIREKITPQTRAIMPVAIYGHPRIWIQSWSWRRRTASPSWKTRRRRTGPNTSLAATLPTQSGGDAARSAR